MNLNIDHYRDLALRYLDIATAGPTGVGEGDMVYRSITEGRDSGRAYSSCGDLCHWLLFRLGVRMPFINRAEHTGWRMGKNISDLVWKCPAAGRLQPEHHATHGLHAGDIIAVWNHADGTDAHVMVVRSKIGSGVHTADYGQPGGYRRTRTLSSDGMLDERRLQKVIPLARVLELATAAGQLVESQDPSDWFSTWSTPDAL